MIFNNKNNVAVIAGGMGYVGRAIAEKLAKNGMRVVILYRNSSQKDVSDMLHRLSGHGHKAYHCDLANTDQVKQVMDLILKEMGPVFVSIYAAGSMPQQKQLLALTETEFRKSFDEDVVTCFNFLSTYARELKKNKNGIIIGITTAGVVTNINTKARGVYSPIKFAKQGMLVALKEELAPFNVSVFSIAPGFMRGGLNKAVPEAFVDMIREKIPTKKLAEAGDVAEIVSKVCLNVMKYNDKLTFLVAPESDSI